MNPNRKIMPPAIEFRNVCLSFDDQPILIDINFTLAHGEMLFVTGVSGSGKSVLLRLAMGLLRPDSGQILIDGQHIETLKESDLLAIRGGLMGIRHSMGPTALTSRFPGLPLVFMLTIWAFTRILSFQHLSDQWWLDLAGTVCWVTLVQVALGLGLVGRALWQRQAAIVVALATVLSASSLVVRLALL